MGMGGTPAAPRKRRISPPGEESLTIFVDKRKLSRRAEPAGGAGNSSGVSLETLHQLAASYFIDRESTLRRLHHIQIATAAIKVGKGARERAARADSGSWTHQWLLKAGRDPEAASQPREGRLKARAGEVTTSTLFKGNWAC